MNYDKLESLAKSKGVSKTHLCQLVGRERYYLRDCKNKNTEPPEDYVMTWADALGTTVDYLTDKTEQKEKPTESVSLDDLLPLVEKMTNEELLKLLKAVTEKLT